MRTLLADLADLAFPRECIGCNAGGTVLCPICIGEPGLIYVDGDLPTVAARGYESGIRSALLAYKERGRRDLAPSLGAVLAEAIDGLVEVLDQPIHSLVLVPVPSRRGIARARGGSHVLRLARHAARLNRVRIAPDALCLARAVRDSAGLDARERARNLRNAMSAGPPPAGVAAVIVDDIVTTGATTAEAARALEAAGWPVAGVAVVAAVALDSQGGAGSLRRTAAESAQPASGAARSGLA